MGQIQSPAPPQSLILTAVDRLVASNSDGGISPNASHLVLLGESAGQNMGDVDHVYVIGSDSLKGGFANAAQEGTIVLGANNLTAFTGAFSQPQLEGPIISIGFNVAPLIRDGSSSLVLIGARIAFEAPATKSGGFDATVIIGNEALERMRTDSGGGGNFCRRTVAIGYRVLRGKAFSTPLGAGTAINECVFIGAEAGQNAGVDTQFPGVTIEGTIAIGTRALSNVNSNVGNQTVGTIAIGNDCAVGSSYSQGCIWIGAGITATAFGVQTDVMIGAAIAATTSTGASQNVGIGANASFQGLGSRNIMLGSGANGTGEIAGGSDQLLIETVNASTGVRRNLVYGNMGTLTGANVTACGLVLGRSSAANRDLPGMNVVKLLNGSWDGTNPVGGGLFYYDAVTGLHFVGAAGTDTPLAPP